MQPKKPTNENNTSDVDLDPLDDLNNDAPPEFICPITMAIMRDPVILPDGQTYEREAIKRALEVNPISPLTREPMDMSQARVNYALKNLIDKYIQTNLKEVEKEPSIIDPDNIVQQTQQIDPQIPIIEISQIQLDTFTCEHTSDSMLVTIKPSNINGRPPVSIIAIIDISTSMIIDATLKEAVKDENTSITRIQLVQYSLKTIISTLGKEDKLTIITFADKARVKASGVNLDENGKKRLNQIIDDIDPNGMTNLWDGLDKGINEAIKQQNKKMNTSLLVFTDGQPNLNPPMGLIPTLKEKLSDLNVFFSISTFGYGYNIDANLLEEIAEIGNGIYGYIPDASMVGTIFINYLSNFVSILSPFNKLNVTFNNKKTKSFDVILYNGSETNVMIDLGKNDNPENAQINLSSVMTNETLLVKEIKKLDEDDEDSVLNFKNQKYRKSLIDLILRIKDSFPISELRNDVLALFDQLKNEKNRSQFMKYLMMDLYSDDEQHGDIERAFLKDNFNTWGKNYLFSLLRFHMLEQCGNFRDMSLQLYGNDCFLRFRKVGNKIFMNLPIPEKKDPYEKSRKNLNKYLSSCYQDDSDDQDDDDDRMSVARGRGQRREVNAGGRNKVVKGMKKRAAPKKAHHKQPDEDEDEDDDDGDSDIKIDFNSPVRFNGSLIQRGRFIRGGRRLPTESRRTSHKMIHKDSKDSKDSDDDSDSFGHCKPKVQYQTQRMSTMRIYNQRKKPSQK